MARADRIDTANRLIRASSDEVYQAFIDPNSWLQWLPPAGMSGEIITFNAWEGGTYELILTYAEAGHGKSTSDTDRARGTFVELVPGQYMVQLVEFASDDPAFSGTMRMTWTINSEEQGSRVTIIAEDVPVGISAENHELGMQSTLENLAWYLESKSRQIHIPGK